MKRKLVFWALSVGVMLALSFFGAIRPSAAQGGVQLSGSGCSVGVNFDAAVRTTYIFEVFAGSDLLDEQSFTPQPDTTLPVPVAFSYTYTGPLPAPTVDILVWAGDDELASFSEITALTSGCGTQPPSNDDQSPTPPPNDGNGDESPAPSPVTGANVCGADLSDAVGGSFIVPADLYAAPGVPIEPWVGIAPGQSAWVLGVDESGEYYKILWGCDQLWVLVETIGPNYDDVWNGMPLPTNVVS